MIVGTNHPLRAYKVWEDEPYSIVEPYDNTPPNFELILDPSDSMIIGNRFRKGDVVDKVSGNVWDCWVPGTQFKNIRTGCVFLVYEKVSFRKLKNRVIKEKNLSMQEVKPSDQLELSFKVDF